MSAGKGKPTLRVLKQGESLDDRGDLIGYVHWHDFPAPPGMPAPPANAFLWCKECHYAQCQSVEGPPQCEPVFLETPLPAGIGCFRCGKKTWTREPIEPVSPLVLEQIRDIKERMALGDYEPIFPINTQRTDDDTHQEESDQT